MLTNDLVRVTSRKGKILPRYIDPAEGEHLRLAEELVATFRRHRERPRGELEGELKDLLGTGTAFQLHRGLSKLLFDRCEFDTRAPCDPEELRRRTFRAAAASLEARGLADPLADRKRILAQVAAELELEPSQVERGLYADLKDQQLLIEFKECNGEWLLHRYNSALAQAVLLRAEELKIEIQGQSQARYRALFRKLKFFQLLHRIEKISGGYRITLDGPLSLFQSSTRYGLQMASFLPTLLHFGGWRLEARLLWGKKRIARSFELAAEQGLAPYGRLTGQWQPDEMSWLPEQFAKLKTEWKVSTDAEIVDLGGQGVLVPDFVFHHPPSGRRVLMEIFGFWNRGSVKGRLDLLRRHGPKDLILALSRSLAADPAALEDLPAEVYVFRSAPIAREVRRLLEAREEARTEVGDRPVAPTSIGKS